MNKIDFKIFCETLAWGAAFFGVCAFGAEWFRPGYVDMVMPIFIPWVVAAAAAIISRTL